MTKIKPDTSAYTELPDRLRAAAEVLSAMPVRVMQSKPRGTLSDWWPDDGAVKDILAFVIEGHRDIRIAPEPRERWLATDQHGTDYGPYYSEPQAEACAANLDKTYPGLSPHTIARFVEVV